MTITQTVEILADRRLIIDVPLEVPMGKAQVEVKVIPLVKKETVPLLALRGSCKGIDTMDAYFARKRANRAFEEGSAKNNPYRIAEQ